MSDAVVEIASRVSALADRCFAEHRSKLENAERYPHLPLPVENDLLGAILVGIADCIGDTDGLYAGHVNAALDVMIEDGEFGEFDEDGEDDEDGLCGDYSAEDSEWNLAEVEAHRQAVERLREEAPWIIPGEVDADYRLVPPVVFSAISAGLGAWLSMAVAGVINSDDPDVCEDNVDTAPLYSPLFMALVCGAFGLDECGFAYAAGNPLVKLIAGWKPVGFDRRLFVRQVRVMSGRLDAALGDSHAQRNAARMTEANTLEDMRAEIHAKRRQAQRQSRMDRIASKVGVERANWLVAKARLRARTQAGSGR